MLKGRKAELRETPSICTILPRGMPIFLKETLMTRVREIRMDRPAQPEEVAPAFVFFASEADFSYITGEVLTLLGGETTAA